MAGPRDGRYRLTQEGVLVYDGSHGLTSMAHARLYEAVEQEPVVIVGDLQDNPGNPALEAVDSLTASVRATWLAEEPAVRLLVYDVEGQTFTELAHAGDDGLGEFVSILDVLGVMPELFNPDQYTAAQLGGSDAAEFRGEAERRNTRRLQTT